MLGMGSDGQDVTRVAVALIGESSKPKSSTRSPQCDPPSRGQSENS